MQRFHQLLFAVSLAALSWLGMMAVHELGHVIGALLTGGSVERVVLHPLAISRTDLSANPHPAVVVWLGPLIGCGLPLVLLAVVPRRNAVARAAAWFFAGFCLVANGAYIGGGSFAAVGDCGEMLRTGTPLWMMLLFGAAAAGLGLWLWHGLGSLRRFVADPSLVRPRWAWGTAATTGLVVVLELALTA